MSCQKLLTASRMKSFLSCERSHYNRYDQGWDSKGESLHLAFGHVLHAGLEAYWKLQEVNRLWAHNAAISATSNAAVACGLKAFDDGISLTKVLILVDAYCERYQEVTQWETVFVEREFLLPLMDPWWGGQFRHWSIGGKIDVGVRHRETGKFFLMDHKTCALDTSDGAPYWQTMEFDHQISMYWTAACQMGLNPDGFIYDVIVKPKITRQLATPPEKRKYRKDGQLYKGQHLDDESIEAFSNRYHDLVFNNLESNFTRKVFGRTAHELDVFKGEMCNCVDRIESTQNENSALRNTAACYLYFKSCPYLASCGGAALDRMENIEQRKPFPELEEESTRDKESSSGDTRCEEGLQEG